MKKAHRQISGSTGDGPKPGPATRIGHAVGANTKMKGSASRATRDQTSPPRRAGIAGTKCGRMPKSSAGSQTSGGY